VLQPATEATEFGLKSILPESWAGPAARAIVPQTGTQLGADIGLGLAGGLGGGAVRRIAGAALGGAVGSATEGADLGEAATQGGLSGLLATGGEVLAKGASSIGRTVAGPFIRRRDASAMSKGVEAAAPDLAPPRTLAGQQDYFVSGQGSRDASEAIKERLVNVTASAPTAINSPTAAAQLGLPPGTTVPFRDVLELFQDAGRRGYLEGAARRGVTAIEPQKLRDTLLTEMQAALPPPLARDLKTALSEYGRSQAVLRTMTDDPKVLDRGLNMERAQGAYVENLADLTRRLPAEGLAALRGATFRGDPTMLSRDRPASLGFMRAFVSPRGAMASGAIPTPARYVGNPMPWPPGTVPTLADLSMLALPRPDEQQP
jgi:hypothetical protein